MKIIVFVKQVPDTDNIKLNPKTGNLMREGVSAKINPVDRNVLEAAMCLKEEHQAHVTAVTMGPPQAKTVLMKALAFGCDDAVLLSDRAFGGADTLATGYTLAMAAEKLGDYDLLLTGKNSDDGDTAQVGGAVAAFLDIPHVTLAASVAVSDGWAYCDRALEKRTEKVRVKLPALVCITKEANTPRYPAPVNIIAALDKPLYVWDAEALGADKSRTGLAGSPSITKKVYEPPKANTDTVYFSGSSKEAASKFVDLLDERGLI